MTCWPGPRRCAGFRDGNTSCSRAIASIMRGSRRRRRICCRSAGSSKGTSGRSPPRWRPFAKSGPRRTGSCPGYGARRPSMSGPSASWRSPPCASRVCSGDSRSGAGRPPRFAHSRPATDWHASRAGSTGPAMGMWWRCSGARSTRSSTRTCNGRGSRSGPRKAASSGRSPTGSWPFRTGCEATDFSRLWTMEKGSFPCTLMRPSCWRTWGRPSGPASRSGRSAIRG